MRSLDLSNLETDDKALEEALVAISDARSKSGPVP